MILLENSKEIYFLKRLPFCIVILIYFNKKPGGIAAVMETLKN
jgi:hypothetical protein